jgi:hypothetical protein
MLVGVALCNQLLLTIVINCGSCSLWQTWPLSTTSFLEGSASNENVLTRLLTSAGIQKYVDVVTWGLSTHVVQYLSG